MKSMITPELCQKVLLPINRNYNKIQEKYIEDLTRWREDINFIFEWQNNILRMSIASE